LGGGFRASTFGYDCGLSGCGRDQKFLAATDKILGISELWLSDLFQLQLDIVSKGFVRKILWTKDLGALWARLSRLSALESVNHPQNIAFTGLTSICYSDAKDRVAVEI
jgi:hypothetical protein